MIESAKPKYEYFTVAHGDVLKAFGKHYIIISSDLFDETYS